MNFDKLPIEDLIKPVFNIGETEYNIDKFGALEGWRIFERLRLQIGKSPEIDIDGNLDDKAILSWLKAILAMDLTFIENLRTTLFQRISFRTNEVITPQTLLDAEDMAIGEPLEIYEIIFRSLAVNFTPSFRGIISRLTGE